jgi:undecaprenyl diphosphate synthase
MSVDAAALPRHLAVIMDGNGRWAVSRGLPRTAGHRAGVDAVRNLITECRKLGIAHLTLYTFSRENWSRPATEVGFLFDLLVQFLTGELPDLIRWEIRLLVLGDVDELPLAARKALRHACEKTAGNTGMTLNLALNYSGREEIVKACRQIVQDGLPPEAITQQALAARLYTAEQPDPDLLIRTSGEQRISNFLLFQSAYSEYYFTPTLWPDFTGEELHKALAAYAGRQRRFGQTGDSRHE